MGGFGTWITQHNWEEIDPAADIQVVWDNYQTTITAAYHLHFPTQVATTHPNDPPWFNQRVKRLLTQRNEAFAANDAHLYRQLRNRVIREIKIAKLQYYPTKIAQLKATNPSKWYFMVKDLAGLSKPSPTLPFLDNPSTPAATVLNQHFSAICQSLPPLATSALPAYLPAPSPLPLFPLTKYTGNYCASREIDQLPPWTSQPPLSENIHGNLLSPSAL